MIVINLKMFKMQKIPAINPPVSRMNKEGLCVHFSISYNTLKKRAEPIRKIIDFDKKRVFEGKELQLLFTYLHYLSLFPQLKTLYSSKEITKTDLKKIYG